MDDLISRQAVLEGLASIAKAKAKSDAQKSLMGRTMFFVERLPSVNPQENLEDIHREREQAYMRGYEDASKRYRTEPCEDAISRSDAIRVASGYCHWTNIPDELAKLPSVNPIPCEDAISRQAVLALAKDIHVPIGNAYVYYSHRCIDPQEIRELPPVSVAEKVGHGIFVQYDFDPRIGNWHCSECKNIIFQGVEKKGIHGEVIYKFCPWCGAKMVEPQESEVSDETCD